MMRLTRIEHNPPHIHAYYGDYDASFHISNGEIMDGRFPSSEAVLVEKFVMKYQKELMEIWDTETYRKFPPID